MVYSIQRDKKIVNHWSYKVPQRYKCNASFLRLDRAKTISRDFVAEVTYSIGKF